MPVDELRLDHVYWIGCSPCAGKSTIADRIAAEHDMAVYRCDDAYYEHIRMIDSGRQPIFHKLSQSDADSIWLRPIDQQIDEEPELYREEFPMILEDLLAMPSDRPIIAEGAALLPELLGSMDLGKHRTAWIIPTEAFQRRHYEQRDWRHDVLRECSDPERG